MIGPKISTLLVSSTVVFLGPALYYVLFNVHYEPLFFNPIFSVHSGLNLNFPKYVKCLFTSSESAYLFSPVFLNPESLTMVNSMK